MKSRVRKKLIKNSIIVIDLNSIPDYITDDMISYIKFMRETGIIYYDSELGKEPKVFPRRNRKVFNFKRYDKTKHQTEDRINIQ